jgi:hypothetical protein
MAKNDNSVKMRRDNKGLTARINFWSMEKHLDDFKPEKARMWIQGEITNAETLEREKFNDPGTLLTILGEWNVKKFKQLRAEARKKP